MDVAILVPLEEEFRQLFEYIVPTYKSEKDPRTGRSFYRFSRIGPSGKQFECVTTFIGDMGEKEAASLTRKLIDSYEPHTIVLLGIAGSLSSNVRICDVVVADQVDDYLARARANTGEDHRLDFELSGKSYRPDIRLLNTIKFFRFDHPDMHKRLSSDSQADIHGLGGRIDDELVVSELIGKEFQLHWGPVASGDIVAASADFCRWLLGRDRKYRAIEMEAAGVMSEIYESAGAEKVMVLRGISDCSDERKAKLDQIAGGSLRAIALRNAIRLLWMLFEIGAFEHSTERELNKPPNACDLPNSLEQAQQILGRLGPAERHELKEIVLILELLCAKVAHFQRPDFFRRLDELTLSPVLIPKDMSEALRETKDLFNGEGLSWGQKALFKSAALFYRKKLNAMISTKTGFTENALWERLLTRKPSTAAAFLICTLYDIKAGVVSQTLEARIRHEFEIRSWSLPPT